MSGSVFVFIWYYKASVFSMFSIITLIIVFSCGEDPSFFLCSSLFCKRCVYSFITLVSCLFILGVLGLWEFLWRAGSYIFCVCDSAVWSAGPVQFYLGASVEQMAGLYKIFLFFLAFLFWLCCSGYGTVELVRGGLSFSRFL